MLPLIRVGLFFQLIIFWVFFFPLFYINAISFYGVAHLIKFQHNHYIHGNIPKTAVKLSLFNADPFQICITSRWSRAISVYFHKNWFWHSGKLFSGN